MSTDFPPLPSIDARMQAQERLSTILHARIEQLSQDMQASFHQLAAYQIQAEKRMDERFDAIESRLEGMATKQDLTTMEDRILGAFQNLMNVIEDRLPKQEQ